MTNNREVPVSVSEYVVLRTFDSEVEARVVESFLKAKGFDVQILGAHMHQMVSVKGYSGTGLRLIIKEEFAAGAEQAMKDAELKGAPELNAGTPPPLMSKRDYIVMALFVALGLIVFAISRLSWP